MALVCLLLLLLLWYFHFDKVVGLQGSSGSRKSSFDSPGVTEEEAADGRQVGMHLKRIKQANTQTVVEEEAADGINVSEEETGS